MSAANLAKGLYGIGVIALTGAAWISGGLATALLVLGIGSILAAFVVWLQTSLLN
jgi:hypothetical protein